MSVRRRNNEIVTIGSVTRDVFMMSPEIQTVRSRSFATGAAQCVALGSKVPVDEIVYTVGGSAANAAVSFARQGFRTACIGRVGRDIRGEEITRVLSRERIDTSHLQTDPLHYTAYSTILLTKSGERSILGYRGAGEFIRDRGISWRSLRNAKWFYITHCAGASASLYAKLIRFAARHGIRVATNPGPTQLKKGSAFVPLLRHVDIFIVNREEASYFVNIPYRETDHIFRKLDRWVKGVVVMTDGPLGMWVSDGRARYHAGVLRERKTVDRTGAGDAFGSGFVAAYVRSKGNIPAAIQAGSANATSVLEYIGAQEGILRKRQSTAKWGKLKITKQVLTHYYESIYR